MTQGQNRSEAGRTDVRPTGDQAVVARDLTRRFGKFTAVDHLDLNVGRGEIFGFLGANGAGKTTAIRMFCGLLKPTSGEAWVDGLPISRDAEKIKHRIGYMSQRFSLYDDLLIDENANFYGGVYGLGRKEIEIRKGEQFERLGLTHQKRTLTRELPLGFKQRLALACAMLHRPKLLFLDEPTGGVDPAARREFWNLIYETVETGATVFVTTHYMDEAEYCDRIGLIYRGELIALGSPEVLKSEQMPEDVLECLCGRPQEALFVLEHIPGVKEAALFGKGLHLVVEKAETVLDTIRQTLMTQGFEVSSLEKIRPSLEDVFVSLIEARARAEAPQIEVRK